MKLRFLMDDHLLTVTSHGRKGKGAFSSCFYKGAKSHSGGQRLLKDPSPNNVILGVRISTYEFWEDRNIQSMVGGDV